MTKTQHTPGPWKAERDIATNGSFNIFGSFNAEGLGVRLAVVTSGPAELSSPQWGCPEFLGTQGGANADLMSAAPDMLAALEGAERFVSGLEGDELQHGVAELLTAMRFAIAKARRAA